ncbi:MAG: RluA family pseudouridine synthase [Pseudomonadota bacterium]|nr:RluA family pseudouridine synthase [Pseudomonadota bacterium]
MSSSAKFHNKVLRIIINQPNGRLDKVIVNSLPHDVGLSRTQVKNLIKMGSIRTALAGQSVHQKYQLTKNEVLLIDLYEPSAPRLLPEAIPLEIVFEDEHIIVINKQPGLVVHPGAGVHGGTLVNGLVNHCGELANFGGGERPGIVHRLDKDTSGLLVVAKSNCAYLDLIKQFSQHTAKRKYLAILWGLPNPINSQKKGINLITLEAEGIFKIEGKIGRHQINRKKMTMRKDGGGKNAITRCKILASFIHEQQVLASLASCWLETGRTHQIRVHMDAINHGIVGDLLYRSGRKSNLDLSRILGMAYDSFKRQALHAEKLSFQHPVSKHPLQFKVKPPPDFQRLLEAFERI